ncbi:CARDB domain-containing protein [Paenibacillus sp. N3.4]|uniref:CARDB domain-containing protein n=1 Tax=Paenibacillus sp. N3.4 TaxID=2603222 RepID=UPI0011CC148D|nr:CARDB domain-containing protein [Paenibacillus sp. N3.4]TXK86018.1 hypothetical protein FU659_00785 [Paenibacillus sp. N3.4]
MKKANKQINLIILFIFSIQLLIPLFETSIFAASPLTKRIYINFNSNTADSSQNEYVYPEKTKSFTFKLDGHVTGEIKSWKLFVNNLDKTSLASLQGYNLNVNNLQGQIGLLYSQQSTNPGHHIYRLPSGTAWEHTGKYTPIMQFDADSSTYDGNTFSQYPGLIPTEGHARNSSTMISYPEDLRYDGLKGIAPNWNGYGAGVTASYDPTPPSIFYHSKQDFLDNSKNTISLNQIDNASIRITGGFAKPNLYSNAVIPYDWGRTSGGENYIKIFRKFEKGLLDDGVDYYGKPDTGKGEDRNYLMEVQTEWAANAYFYSGYIDVTYLEIDKPDLVAIDIVPSVSCFQQGETVQFEYQFRNIGPDTSTPFKVEIRIDGVLLKTDDWTGATQDTPLGRTFSYKFTSPLEKSITVKLDSTNAIDEETKLNNTISKVFIPSSSCGPVITPEKVDGAFTIEKPRLKFGESNSVSVINVSVTGGDSCAYLNTTAKFTQDNKLQTSNTNGKIHSFNGLPYPKGMGVGFVQVSVTIKTTCGTVKDLGTKSFEIYIDNSKPNSPPVFTPGFVNRGNVNAIQPLINVQVGTHVDLQILHTPEILPDTKATPYDPDGDAFIYIWDFDNTNADWLKTKYVDMGWWQYDERYSYFIPDKLGTFQIQVTAMDYRGASSTKTATINVVPPNPVPVINVPSRIVEGRTFTPDISGANSYSPFGYSIVQYVWGNKRTIYPTSGQEIVTLDVVDSNGLHAITPASTTINVLPDLPPIAQAFVPPTGLRNNQMIIQDSSYSPDNDPILIHTDTITCDSNNNGSFEDETPVAVTRDANGNIYFSASRVGKCKLHIFIQEAEGYKKSDSKDYYFEILNDQPVATFAMAGQIQPPPLELPKKIATDTFLQPNWKTSTLDGDVPLKAAWFKNSSGELQTAPYFQNSDKYAGQSSPYNAPNPSTLTARDVAKGDYEKALLGEDITINMDAALTQWEIRRNGTMIKTAPLEPKGSYWYNPRPELYSVTEQYLYLYSFTAFSGDCDGYGNNWWSIPIEKILDPSYILTSWAGGNGPKTWCGGSPVNSMLPNTQLGNPVINWSSPDNSPLTISKVLDSRTLWTVTEPNTNSWWTSYDRTIPFNSDLSKFAYMFRFGSNDSYHLEIRDANSTSLLKDITIATTPFSKGEFIGYYKDIFLLSLDSKVYAYDFNGTLLWSKSSVDKNSAISKDGYLVGMTASISGTFKGIYSLQVVDIKTGNLISEAPFITESGRDYYRDFKPFTLNTRILDNGKVYVRYGYYETDCCESTTTNYKEKILEGSVLNTAIKEPYRSYGQLYDPQVTNQNAEFTYAITFKSGTSTKYFSQETAGFSFRIQNAGNMYRVEHNRYSTKLVSYVNGNRTVIGSIDWPISENTPYNIKIKLNGTHIKVYMNGSPVLDKDDTIFTEAGSYGPYAVKGNVQFKGISVLNYPPTKFMDNVVVVGQPIVYNTSYSDPENDPAMPSRAKWIFTNQQPYKYLNNGDGYSEIAPNNSYNNLLVTSPNPTLSKVGFYKVDYQIPDDPSPPGYSYADGVFSSYSQYSDPYTQLVKVVRVPIAQFTIQKNANNTLSPIDASFDPDRWLSASNYQAGYGTNRGIFDQKWKYTAPDGTEGFGFPTNPNQTGTYIVSLVVMQEDGIWSEWYEQTVNVLIPVPNNPPTAVLTFPNGTQASPSYVNTLMPTIKWNQSDPDVGTIFASFHVVIKDVNGNVVIDSGIQPLGTSATSGQWTLDQSLVIGQAYQVQVAVNDGTVWSTWSNIGWMITNRPPKATMTIPDGTQSNPTMFSTLRPTLHWIQTDPDPGTTFIYFQIQITNEANDTIIVDSGQQWQYTSATSGNWTVPTNLPAREKLRVRVRVNDGITWSDYSPQTWFYINRAPVADFDWFPKPVWEGDFVQMSNGSFDPDGDALTYDWKLEGPNGAISHFFTKDITHRFLLVGIYKVTLTVSDGILSDTRVKAITAKPLTILSDVMYTEDWRLLHERSGHQTLMAPRDFYSGEIFMVSSISAPAAVDEVTAWMDTVGMDGNSLFVSVKLLVSNEDATLFKGELFDPKFQSLTEGLPRGIQHIHFKIQYHNGRVKTESVPVQIIGNVNQSVGVHRVQ